MDGKTYNKERPNPEAVRELLRNTNNDGSDGNVRIIPLSQTYLPVGIEDESANVRVVYDSHENR